MEKILFTPFGGTPLMLKREIPASMQHLVIPGSIVLSAQDWFGTILYQVIKFPECSFGYWLFDCKKEVSFSVQRERSFTLLFISLAQQTNCFLRGFGNISLPTNGSYLLHLPILEAVLHCTKDNRYSYLGLEFEPAVYHHFAPEFLLLDRFLHQTILQAPNSYTDTPIILPDSIQTFITDFFAGNYKGSVNLETGSRQLKKTLYALLHESYPVQPGDATSIDMLHKLRNSIRSDFRNTPDLHSFAKQHNISKTKLEKDFKRLFGRPPHQYWQSYRMHGYASRLLTEESIKIADIAERLGYGDAGGNFSRSFQHFVQLTPQQYRKHYKRKQPICKE